MLRESRMRQGLDISDVEARTKIRAKYLRALENEEWGMLPGSTFVKSFLRTYAEALGLDPHLIVEEYRVNHEEPDEIELQPFSAPPGAGREPLRIRRPGPPSPGLLLAVVVVGVLAFLIILGSSGNDDDEPDSASQDRTETTQRPKKRREQPPPAPTRVTLRIVPQGETYVCLDRGTDTPILFEGILTEAQTFRGKRLRLNLGRRAVEMRANGKAVPVQPSAEPLGLDFRPRGWEELPEGERPCA
jgi:cytoskeleton protein RodZ